MHVAGLRLRSVVNSSERLIGNVESRKSGHSTICARPHRLPQVEPDARDRRAVRHLGHGAHEEFIEDLDALVYTNLAPRLLLLASSRPRLSLGCGKSKSAVEDKSSSSLHSQMDTALRPYSKTRPVRPVRRKVTTWAVEAAALDFGLHQFALDGRDRRQRHAALLVKLHRPKGARQVKGKGRGTIASEKTHSPEKRTNPRSHDIIHQLPSANILKYTPWPPSGCRCGEIARA